MNLSTPSKTNRYAVVSTPFDTGPADVSFWDSYTIVIDLMTRHSNSCFSSCLGFSVWHRRTATSAWKLITDTH